MCVGRQREGRPLESFALWAIQECSAICAVHAIPCAIAVVQDNKLEMKAISEQYPLSKCVHFVAGIDIPKAAVAEAGPDFEGLYASLGVLVVMTVLNGDCACDVMLMMLAERLTDAARSALRIEISDYLMSRAGEPWMHDIMSSRGKRRASSSGVDAR